MKIMSVRAPDSLKNKLSQHAKKHGLTRNALILQILWSYVEQQEKEKQLDERR